MNFQAYAIQKSQQKTQKKESFQIKKNENQKKSL